MQCVKSRIFKTLFAQHYCRYQVGRLAVRRDAASGDCSLAAFASHQRNKLVGYGRHGGPQ